MENAQHSIPVPCSGSDTQPEPYNDMEKPPAPRGSAPVQAARKVAMVTGGASGIGRAVALKVALSGVFVVVVDQDEQGCKETVRQVQEQGGQAEHTVADVSDEDQVQQAVRTLRDAHGLLDYAVNAAGVEGERAPLHLQATADFNRVMSVNARGVWLCMKHQIPLMLESGRDSAIVVVSSTAGLSGMPEFSPYSMSKHALMGLVRSAALEYAGKIRVNAVCPGTTATPMVERFSTRWPEWQAATNTSYPIGRIAQPEEVADAVHWLLTGATFTTGQHVALDGGSLA